MGKNYWHLSPDSYRRWRTQRGENIAPGDVELQANIKRIEAIMNAFGINYPTTDTDSDAQPYYTPEAVDGGEVPNGENKSFVRFLSLPFPLLSPD